MGGKDQSFQVVYRGQVLERWVPGGWVFFQRPKACGGGFWLGRTEDGFFSFSIEYPISLADGVAFLMACEAEERRCATVPDDGPNYSLF